MVYTTQAFTEPKQDEEGLLVCGWPGIESQSWNKVRRVSTHVSGMVWGVRSLAV